MRTFLFFLILTFFKVIKIFPQPEILRNDSSQLQQVPIFEEQKADELQASLLLNSSNKALLTCSDSEANRNFIDQFAAVFPEKERTLSCVCLCW